MAENRYISIETAQGLVDDLMAGRLLKDGIPTSVLSVVGSPQSGKSRVAFEAFVAPQRAALVQQGRSVLVVSHRSKADALSNEAIARVRNSVMSRPVKTLVALAFELLRSDRAARKQLPPKLLNGAEQDAIIDEVLAVHVRHAERGDDCETCSLLRRYFSVREDADRQSGPLPQNPSQIQTTADIFRQMMTPAFAAQLRDMFARMAELHFSVDAPEELELCEEGRDAQSRECIEWNLAAQLRVEYARRVEEDFPDQYRIDSSYILVDAENSVRRLAQSSPEVVPQLVIVDDSQDLTLAGFSFLEALVENGTKLVLLGNDDESVQSFRGAYPEVISEMVCAESGMNAVRYELEPLLMTEHRGAYATHVVSRVSLSIGSVMTNTLPLPQRPGKLPAAGAVESVDGSLRGRLFRSPAEELDDLVWQIKSMALSISGGTWDDYAVIAHDNATLRAIGKRFEEENIPVSYSSMTRPLREETVVQGLLALLQLVDMARRQPPVIQTTEAGRVRALFERVVNSPLVQVENFESFGSSDETTDHVERADHRTERTNPVERAVGATEPVFARPLRTGKLMAALESLAVLEAASITATESGETEEGEEGAEARARFAVLRSEWERLTGAETRTDPAVVADLNMATDSDVSATSETVTESGAHVVADTPTALGSDELLTILLLGSSEARATVMGLLTSILKRGRGRSGDRDVESVRKISDIIWTARNRWKDAPSGGVHAALWYVWDACDVAESWRKQALDSGRKGLEANRLLDTVIRLFAHAEAADPEESLQEFIDTVSALDIEADSLAKVAPRDNAVILTTPAGASGMEKRYVWIPSLQQDVWPNLTPRNTLFGAEILADTVLSRRLHGLTGFTGSVDSVTGSARPRLATLYSEMKSLLVALTRGTQQVTVSAVRSDEMSPSEFLTVFMPELFPPMDSDDAEQDFTQVGVDDSVEGAEPSRGGLDASPRGLVAVARATLAAFYESHPDAGTSIDELPQTVADAAQTLRYLARAGVSGAAVSDWTFVAPMRDVEDSEDSGVPSAKKEKVDADVHDDEITVTLSPSSVDGIWQCPLKWAMENKYNGPRQTNTAMSFGTLIHACAQYATEQGWDMDREKSAEEIAQLMMHHFAQLRAQQPQPREAADRYAVRLQNGSSQTVLKNIATYFVESRESSYGVAVTRKHGESTEKSNVIGMLTSVEAEKEFHASFSLKDFVSMLRNVDGLGTVEAASVAAVLTTLAQGFDADFSQKTRITLSGRIDRLEHREAKEKEGEWIHVVDYKTGEKHSSPQVFSDLQLVCYQLGMLFAQKKVDGKTVERSMLFDVKHGSQPAAYYGAEGGYQPALFADRERFNTQYTPRPHAPRIGTFFKDHDHDSEVFAALENLGEAAAENDQLLWCLSMISRIFYAAGYRQADRFVPKRGKQCTYCAFKGICPAWPEVAHTVYGDVETQRESQSGQEERA
ncbi:MAG: PD-(D/E)XK nuclease family protein [Bifidobacteriaceae bacterium]|jgi:superfamily I DNA/RNA helicase|nr:PD-(D/E)XK nuclease family protein [Bifidobacteriaceae bacterium]MCI1979247.1 PD-(D/E)XK nuclease family protein [Bifidobacteriaceae bacterium]